MEAFLIKKIQVGWWCCSSWNLQKWYYFLTHIWWASCSTSFFNWGKTTQLLPCLQKECTPWITSINSVLVFWACPSPPCIQSQHRLAASSRSAFRKKSSIYSLVCLISTARPLASAINRRIKLGLEDLISSQTLWSFRFLLGRDRLWRWKTAWN